MQYFVRRLVQAIWAVFGSITIVFVLMSSSGDPAVLLVPSDAPNYREALESMRQQLGTDKPLIVRYGQVMSHLLRGDFGYSIRERRPAFDVVIERLPATFALAGVSFAIATIVGVLLGVVGASARKRSTDSIVNSVALLGLTIPSYWLSLILILIFAEMLRWFPAFGGGTFRHLVLPAIALAPYSASIIARVARTSLLDIMHRDYIRTARAKGLREYRIMWKHVLKGAALPIVTTIGLRAGVLLTGSIPVEVVFAFPGAGNLAVQAISFRDTPVVLAFMALFAVCIVAVSLLTDILYSQLDPRVRYS